MKSLSSWPPHRDGSPAYSAHPPPLRSVAVYSMSVQSDGARPAIACVPGELPAGGSSSKMGPAVAKGSAMRRFQRLLADASVEDALRLVINDQGQLSSNGTLAMPTIVREGLSILCELSEWMQPGWRLGASACGAGEDGDGEHGGGRGHKGAPLEVTASWAPTPWACTAVTKSSQTKNRGRGPEARRSARRRLEDFVRRIGSSCSSETVGRRPNEVAVAARDTINLHGSVRQTSSLRHRSRLSIVVICGHIIATNFSKVAGYLRLAETA